MLADNNIVAAGADLAYLDRGRYTGAGAEAAGRVWGSPAAGRTATEAVGKQQEILSDAVGDKVTGLASTLTAQGILNSITDCCNRLCTKLEDTATRNSEQLIALERRNDDHIAALTHQNVEAERVSTAQHNSLIVENLKQFCDLQKGQEAIQGQIKTTSLETENRELRDKLQDEQFDRCCPPKCTPVDPCSGGGVDVTVITNSIITALTPVLQSIAGSVQAMASNNCPGNSGGQGQGQGHGKGS